MSPRRVLHGYLLNSPCASLTTYYICVFPTFSITIRLLLPLFILHACTMKPWQLVQSLKNLKWLLTVRRACSSVYTKFKPGCIATEDHGGAVGVMRLVNDVTECKYSDVHVMWSILKETDQKHQQLNQTVIHA